MMTLMVLVVRNLRKERLLTSRKNPVHKLTISITIIMKASGVLGKASSGGEVVLSCLLL